MKCKDYAVIVAAIFMVIALLHASRLIMGWEVTFAGWVCPQWLSWVGVLVAGFLSYQGFVQGGVIGKR